MWPRHRTGAQPLHTHARRSALAGPHRDHPRADAPVFCPEATCPRRIFAERLPETTAHYARRTLRFSTALDAIGLGLGGEPGARLAGRPSMEVSADTLLRQLLRATPGLPAAVPRVLGVDHWAYRTGQRYGTMLVDLEARRPVELRPDRTAESLAAWLTLHPGTEIIARDRSTEYSRAIRVAAPHVREVADRWHLLHNLRQVLERFFSAASSIGTTARAGMRPRSSLTDATVVA